MKVHNLEFNIVFFDNKILIIVSTMGKARNPRLSIIKLRYNKIFLFLQTWLN